MKRPAIASILAFLLSVPGAFAGPPVWRLATAAPQGQSQRLDPLPGQLRVAYVCFYQSEETSGLNKICYYDCLQSLAAVTLEFTAICPMSIDR